MSMDRGVKVITPPVGYPCTLAEAKEWARIDPTDASQDVTLNLLIAMAAGAAEDLTGRAFIERTYELSLPYFDRCITLPFPPLIEVTQVAYTDINGVQQIVDPSVYEIDTAHEPGQVQPKWTQFWPVIAGLGYTFNPVRIRYRAGYLPANTAQTPAQYLPPELRVWMMSRMASFYDQRAQFIIDTRLVDVAVPRDFSDGILDGLMIGSRYF